MKKGTRIARLPINSKIKLDDEITYVVMNAFWDDLTEGFIYLLHEDDELSIVRKRLPESHVLNYIQERVA